MPQLRTHKSFSDIEQDIQLFYNDGTCDALKTALKVAARALTVAKTASEPINSDIIAGLRHIVCDLLNQRIDELDRT